MSANKYDVQVWLLEALESYDGLMSSSKAQFKDPKMRAKLRLQEAIEAEFDRRESVFLDELQEALERVNLQMSEGKWTKLVVALREARNTKESN